MANPEHVALVRQGREAIAQWRGSHPRARLDLSEADLSRADLSGADLSGARLRGADLSEADLRGAYLSLADLWRADLSGAILRGADLMGAILMGADLSGADLTKATLGLTSLSDMDVSQVKGLTTVKHLFPSSIGVDTLIASVRGAGNRLTEELEAFFLGAGAPRELLQALPTLVAEVKYYSCFICYGQPDLEFAQKLDRELKARGVSCWLYAMDAKVGERTWREIGQKRREAERMVVLCSAKALVRDGVLKEIEEQIDEDLDKLVPISLDDLWKERGFRVVRGDRDLKAFLLERNYADFANLPYEEALGRLLEGLKREPVAAPVPVTGIAPPGQELGAAKGLLAAAGAWADFKELDQVVADIYQQREGAQDRPAALGD